MRTARRRSAKDAYTKEAKGYKKEGITFAMFWKMLRELGLDRS